MTASQIHATFKSALHFLSFGQLKNAFEKTNLLVEELQIGEYADRLDDLQQNYQFLLHYYITGVEDPQRKLVYNKLIAKIYILNSELREELLFRNSSNFEYTQKRYFPHTRHYNSLNELLDSLNYFHSQSALLHKLEDSHEVEMKRLRSNYETALHELFSVFWLAGTYKNEEKSVFSKLMQADYPGWLEKTLLVSALTLNLWRMFDEAKLALLFDACQHPAQQVRQRALVGLCFVLARHNRFLPFLPIVRNRLVLLADDNHIVENLHNIVIQIISTAETDKISKKMREEILPEVMKMSPKIRDKMDSESFMNTDEWNEENPDWQEMLDKSGVGDKLKELSELQLEGADVYMSTFSLLKSFPFFSEFSNWFMPFDGNGLAVTELFKTDDKSLLTAFVSNNVMCNSDKYSFCLSILQMPEAQRGMMKNSFKMDAEQLDEMNKDEALLTPDLTAKNISKQYIQDLFRFFKLYPQHNDFSDMFGYSLLMHRSYLFDILSGNGDFKQSIAEYYFLKSHYNQALELFEEVLKDSIPSAALYQKIGYSYQQTSLVEKALDAYIKADLIQPDDLWTVRKIALCYRLSANFEKALEFYQHVDFLKSDQKSVLMQIGHCYLELGRFKDALNVYFKLDALGEEDVKVWRAISWCSFVSGNLQQAGYYVTKLLRTAPTAHDYLNAGHVAWCERRLSDAVESYRISLGMKENNFDLFLESIKDDRSYLIANGVEPTEIPLLIDELLYNIAIPNR
jgi:tetratricopeptide (TPR) repeat protein